MTYRKAFQAEGGMRGEKRVVHTVVVDETAGVKASGKRTASSAA